MSSPPESIDREALKARYDSIFAGVTPPFAFLDLDALERNARRLLAQAGGLPVRVASKSIRSTAVLRRVLELDPGFRGVLAFTVPEALHLAEAGLDDLVVAYPTVDRGAVARVARLAAEQPERAPVLMVDDRPHLDLIEGAIGGGPARARGLPRRRPRLVAARRPAGPGRAEALPDPRRRARRVGWRLRSRIGPEPGSSA